MTTRAPYDTKWVAVGTGANQVKWSLGGNTWNDATGWEADMKSVSYGYSSGTPIWVALGSGANNIFTSPDGSEWTGIPWPGGGGSYVGYYTSGVAYGTDSSGSPLWIAVGVYNSGSYDILTSTDAQTWTGHSWPGGGGFGCNVAYGTDASGAPLWVAVGSGNTGNDIIRSSNGTSWSGVEWPGGSKPGYGIAFGKDGTGAPLWVAVGDGSSNIYWSPDGQTWTSSNTTFTNYTDATGRGVAYGTDGSGTPIWVAVGGSSIGPIFIGSNESIKTSGDGKNWTTGIVDYGVLKSISYGTDNTGVPVWKAVGDKTNNKIITSPNGTNWTGIDLPGNGTGIAAVYTTTTTEAPTTTTTTIVITDASGNTYSTGDVSTWNINTNTALEISLTNSTISSPVQFSAPPQAFLPTAAYATFLSTPNPQMIAYPAISTTDSSSCTVITISNNEAIAFYFPVSPSVSIVVTDGTSYILLTENVSGSLCKQPFNNTTKTASGSPIPVPVGGTYNVGTYTLKNYGMNGSNVSGPTNAAPCFVQGTRVLTPTGYKRVEELQTGDTVLTAGKRRVPIKLYSFTIEKATKENAPYRIPVGALGHRLPKNDIHVSSRHAVKDSKGRWQIPKYLGKAQQYGIGESVTYYHIECPDYYRDNLIVEETEVESYKNKQGSSGVLYMWDEKLGGWERLPPNKMTTVPTNPKTYMIYSYQK